MRRYDRVRMKTWERNLLYSTLIELTYRCNLDCFYCYNDLNLKGRPLSREQYFDLLSELAEMQVMNLILSGGEPLAHRDFFPIGAKGRELGFLVRVKSNGHALSGPLARRLKDEVDPCEVEVSLHGACAETHDRQTRVPGSFERLMANIPEMTSLGLRVKINTTLTLWNEKELEGMFGIADRLGVRIRIEPVVTPRDDGDTGPQSIAASDEGIRRLFSVQRERVQALSRAAAAKAAVEIGHEGDAGLPPADSSKHCGAGSSTIAIDPYGNVYPCVQWRKAIGNLHEQGVREMWEASPVLAGIRGESAAIKKMLAERGPEAQLMAFCPGIAYTASGDAKEIYPEAQKRMELQREPDLD